jgi:hypothetical protein
MGANKPSVDINFRVMMYFEDLHKTADLLAFITRAHLHCETILVTLLKKRVKRPSALKVDRLDFSEILDLCYALGYVSGPLRNGLRLLTTMRKQTAHNIEYVISEEDQGNFMEAVRTACGLKAEYYLSSNTDFPRGLRKAVNLLLMDLSLHLAESGEQRTEMFMELARFLAHTSGIPPVEFIARAELDLPDLITK